MSTRSINVPLTVTADCINHLKHTETYKTQKKAVEKDLYWGNKLVTWVNSADNLVIKTCRFAVVFISFWIAAGHDYFIKESEIENKALNRTILQISGDTSPLPQELQDIRNLFLELSPSDFDADASAKIPSLRAMIKENGYEDLTKQVQEGVLKEHGLHVELVPTLKAPPRLSVAKDENNEVYSATFKKQFNVVCNGSEIGTVTISRNYNPRDFNSVDFIYNLDQTKLAEAQNSTLKMEQSEQAQKNEHILQFASDFV